MQMVTILRDSLPGLAALPLRESGNKRLLRAQFEGVAGTRAARYLEYDVSELSDGQRALLVLYSLLYFHEHQPFLMCLDEPDNYVALREIQPWVATLQDYCATREDAQAILVSHHPEIMNYLGVDSTFRIEREQGGPTRVKPFAAITGLSPAETLARGWE
jgi:predicted ATPase